MAQSPRKPPPRPPSNRGLRCAIYTRQSRDSGRAFSSCDVQWACCRDFIVERARLGWMPVDQRYDDLGASSEKLDRPGLQHLLADIETGLIDCVVVYRVDRLTRRLIDLAKLMHLFETRGVQLSVVTDPHFGESAAQRLTANIVAAASQFEQELTRERMAESRAALKRKGQRVAGRVPYGYVADRQKQLTVQQREAEHVRRMFELAAEGKRPQEIAAIANKQGWRTRAVQPGSRRLWTARQVLKLLSNPTYAGWIHNGTGTLPGRHQAIVDQTLFDQVRKSIEARRSRSPGRSRQTVTWPLRGILKCGRCGRAMSPSISGYKNFRYRYYRCRSNAGGRPPCSGVCLPAYQAEQFVRSMIGSGDWEGLTSDQREEVGRFSDLWQNLDDWSQEKSLAQVLREVVFDPDAGTVELALVEGAAGKVAGPERGLPSGPAGRHSSPRSQGP